MADPIIIETDENGKPIGNNPPAITQSRSIETGIDGKPIASLGLQGPGKQLDIRNPESPAANPGLMVPPLLGAIGATAGTAAAPLTGGIVNPVIGAMAGAGVGEFLKNKYPETFSESGKSPDLMDSVINTGMAGATELGNQGATAAIRALVEEPKQAVAKFLATKGIQLLPNVKKAMKAGDLESSLVTTQSTTPNSEVSSLINQHNIGGKIADTKEFLSDARDSLKKGKISQGEFDNLKGFADLSGQVDNDKSWGGLIKRTGGGALIMSVANMTGNPVVKGTAASLLLTNETMGYLASRPGVANLIRYVQSHPNNDAVKKLAQQGFLMALRGQEVTMLAPDGTKEKAKINDQGVPQIPR